ncbi:MAG: VOC family protein [Burkholderiaceae bacterium]
MKQSLVALTLLVREYDEAIAWYTRKLGFELLEDAATDGGKRWVRIGPRGSSGTALLLAQAKGDAQRAAVGQQAGGRVFLCLHTDDFDGVYAVMKANEVRFTKEPRYEVYGKVVVFEILYGNRWDFIELRSVDVSGGADRLSFGRR